MTAFDCWVYIKLQILLFVFYMFVHSLHNNSDEYNLSLTLHYTGQ